MNDEGNVEYPLLSVAEADVARCLLQKRRPYFYHFTLEERLPSIKLRGLDPGFEGKDSKYPQRRFEPNSAIRYCLEHKMDLGQSAANTRAHQWDEVAGCLVGHPEQVVLLRTPSRILLSKSFGLDHSHASVRDDVEEIIHPPIATLTAAQFIRIVELHGAISCYDVLSAEHLEVCRDWNCHLTPGNCNFAPLYVSSLGRLTPTIFRQFEARDLRMGSTAGHWHSERAGWLVRFVRRQFT